MSAPSPDGQDVRLPPRRPGFPTRGDLGARGLKKIPRLLRVPKAQVKEPAHLSGNGPLCVIRT